MSYQYFHQNIQSLDMSNESYPGIHTPDDLYAALLQVWKPDTCTPRLRQGWTEQNPTLGQCSITAFLAQDIFGGEVCGILRPGGNYHCYNVVNGSVFDLTSQQFGDEILDYRDQVPQSREVHFSRQEKKERYLMLKERLDEFLRKNIK